MYTVFDEITEVRIARLENADFAEMQKIIEFFYIRNHITFVAIYRDLRNASFDIHVYYDNYYLNIFSGMESLRNSDVC